MQTTNAPTEKSTPSTLSTGPGCLTACNPHTVQTLLALIRQAGLSDSAAAAKAGLSTSSLSGWKREYPDFALALLKAREEFRDTHLKIIFEAARARAGWRASAWLLQHVFPGDYSPRAAEREKFQRLAEQQAKREQAEFPMNDESPATPPVSSSRNAAPTQADLLRRSSSSARADSQNSPSIASEEVSLEGILITSSGKDSQDSRNLPKVDRVNPPAVTLAAPAH